MVTKPIYRLAALGLALSIAAFPALTYRQVKLYYQWRHRTVGLLERSRALDGGFFKPTGAAASPEKTYNATRLLQALGSASSISPLLLNYVDERLQDGVLISTNNISWRAIDDVYYLAATRTVLKGKGNLNKALVEAIRNASRELGGYTIATKAIGGTTTLKNRSGSVLSLGEWLGRSEEITFLEDLAGLPSEQGVSTVLLRLWRGEIPLDVSRPYSMTLVLSLFKSLRNLGYSFSNLGGADEWASTVQARIAEFIRISAPDWLIEIDLGSGIEAARLLGLALELPRGVTESLADKQLADGGFDFVIPMSDSMDPGQTLMALRIYEAAHIDYPRKKLLLASLRKMELPSGPFPEKVITHSDIVLTYMALRAYADLGARLPNRRDLEQYILYLSSATGKGEVTLNPIQLWALIQSRNLLDQTEAAGLRVRIGDGFRPSVTSPRDLANLYYVLALVPDPSVELPNGQISQLASRILSLQNAKGAFTFGNGSELSTTYYSIKVLELIASLPQEVSRRTASWLTATQDAGGGFGDANSNLLGAYQAASLFRDLEADVPVGFEEWVQKELNPSGGFGASQELEDIYYGLETMRLLQDQPWTGRISPNGLLGGPSERTEERGQEQYHP